MSRKAKLQAENKSPLPGAYLGWEWGCLKYTGGNFGGRQKHSNSGCEAACTLVHIYCLAVHLHWVICMICKLYSNKAIKMHQGINKICEVLYMFTIVEKKKLTLKINNCHNYALIMALSFSWRGYPATFLQKTKNIACFSDDSEVKKKKKSTCQCRRCGFNP